MKDYIEAFLDGPLLPKEVTQEEYDNVMKYLNATGFIKMVLEDVRLEERERASKIIEENFPNIISMPTRSFDLKLMKQEALNKLNETV